MARPRKICVVTGTRADYGLLTPLVSEIVADSALELMLVVTGTHLSKNFGMTVNAIEADGFPISARVDILTSGDDAPAVCTTIGTAVTKLAETFADLDPDMVVVLGDRYEILAAVTAAMISRIPIAHIHGGELTEGAFDDAIRHSITKMSHIHFVAAEPYRRRVIQMGESPDRVFIVGAPGLENLRKTDLIDIPSLEASLGLNLTPPVFLATYHPATLEGSDTDRGIDALLSALEQFPKATIIFTGVNADPGRERIATAIQAFVDQNPGRTAVFDSVGQQRYLSLMNNAALVIGNSSSGIIEAPAIGTATVNIGSRQTGRLRASSIVDCEGSPTAIAEAISTALGEEFQHALDRTSHPYGDGFVGSRIVEILKTVNLDGILVKKFHDIPVVASIGDGPVTIIAEAGVNHNGSLETALALVDAAANVGADFVKFQTFSAEALVTGDAPKAAYQARQTGDDGTQFDMLKSLELSADDHRELVAHCRQRGISFLSTPFDLASLALLTDDLGLRRIKIGSGDLTNAPLLLDTARRGCDVILSTGMATMDEIERALSVLAFGYTEVGPASADAFAKAFMSGPGQAALRGRVTLLQCTTEYPASLTDINLRVMGTMAAAFGLPVGFSDHSVGAAAAIGAAARGACVIEKHLTLDRAMKGPDHAASMEPEEFRAMVMAIRDVEAALGSSEKRPTEVEIANRAVARKSLLAACAIAKGDYFTEENLTVKRPESGVSALEYFDRLGRKADYAYAANEFIK